MALNNLQTLTDDTDYLKRKRQEADDAFNQMANIEPEKKILSQLPQRQTGSLGEPKKLSLYEAPTTNVNTKIPGPEAFTNVAAKDRTVSNVGVQYTPQDLQLKDNISKMNAIIKAGVDPTSGKPVTLDQIEKVNQIKQQAGFLRGGTDRRPVDANGFPIATNNTLSKMTDSGLSIQFDPNANIPEGNKQAVMQSYGANDSKAQTLRNLQGDQFTDREFVKNYRPPTVTNGIKPGMNESERIAIRADNTSRANARLAANTSTENNVNASLSDREKNRIEAINVGGQNKLRDIQGQVALDPRMKENQLKPIVVKVADPTDPTGTRVIEEIRMPNAEGTGYVNNQAATFTKPKPATTEKLLKMRSSKDPNFAAAEAEYKMRFGSLPY